MAFWTINFRADRLSNSKWQMWVYTIAASIQGNSQPIYTLSQKWWCRILAMMSSRVNRSYKILLVLETATNYLRNKYNTSCHHLGPTNLVALILDNKADNSTIKIF